MSEARTNAFARTLLGVSQPADIARLLPGVALATAVMLISLPIAQLAGRVLLTLQGVDPSGKASPISGVPVAILLGLLISNLLTLPENLKPGITFGVTKLLRLGIILVGIKLSLGDLLKLGAGGALVVVMPILTGLVFITWFSRILALPERLGILIAAGTSICGVTAILSTAPVIEANDDEIAYAIANITLFGLIGLLLYPYIAHLLLPTSEAAGLFLGVAVHDTSQVVGAAITYKEVFQDDKVLQAATVTKLTRNLFLIVIVPLLGYLHLRSSRQAGASTHNRVQIRELFPVFVIGFVAMIIVRTVGDGMLASGRAYGIWNTADWNWLTAQIGEVWGARYLLGIAMASAGLGTSFSTFKGLGLKPLAAGLAGAVLVGAVGFVMAWVLSPYVKL